MGQVHGRQSTSSDSLKEPGMATVNFQETAQQGLDSAVAAIFGAFGGGKALLKSSGNVFLKVNGIDFKPHVFTSPAVVAAVIRYFQKQGANRVFVMENSTQGNFTRLVFEITGMKRMCRATGATPVYLDETGEMPMYLPGLAAFVNIPDVVHEHLIEKKAENLYISIPKLKTHSMTTVTLGIKNQFGLVHQKSRIADHNFKLHQKIADIFANIQPDFTLVDGLEATNFGHYPAESQTSRCVVPMNLLFGGDNPLAVDIAGGHLLGFQQAEIEHLRLAAAYAPDARSWDQITIENRPLFDKHRQQFSWDLLELFPENVTVVRGQTRCCTEGCKRNTEAVLEVLAQDFNGQGNFSIVMGKDAAPGQVAALKGPVHLAGGCAIADCHTGLLSRLGKKQITLSPGCNNLAATVDGLSKWMKVHPLKLVPVNPMVSLYLLTRAKLSGSKAIIPPLIKL